MIAPPMDTSLRHEQDQPERHIETMFDYSDPGSLLDAVEKCNGSGDMVIRTEKLEVGFSDKFLFRSPNIDLRRGDCAALIGPNGAGKSTFLKTILGQIPPLAGTVTLGESLHIGYFAQAEWEKVWNFPPQLYLPLFEFARINRIPMVALNVDQKPP